MQKYLSNSNEVNLRLPGPVPVPKEILNEWRKIGEKGTLVEKKWNSIYNKKNNRIIK